jgi:hypothetical protein
MITLGRTRYTAVHDVRRISRRFAMNTLRHVLTVGAALLVAGSTADAQLRRSTSTVYPDPQTMPTGTCRVWVDGLPASRQPAPTDCATARRNQPRNSRIIYGSRPTNVYGNRDPRSIPGTPQYDPRYDPRSSQYDPRLDPHNRGNNGRYDQYDRKLEKEREKAAREREKEARKREHEREKAWKKAQRDRDHGRGDDHRYGDRGRSGGTWGTVQQGCADVDRNGICDSAQSSTQVIPRTIPQPVPQGTTQRVCTDANRDGRCDDGGPLIRRTP